jgi:hypothetical protein
MSQAPLQIVLPENLAQFVIAQAANQGLSSPDEFVAELVRVEQKRKAAEEIDRLLLEALDSGPPFEAPPDYCQRKLESLRKRRDDQRGGASS